ncbi:MAG: transketolase family protein [Atopobiaceae bacterium]
MSEILHMDVERARTLDAKDPKEVFGETMARLADRYPLLSVVVSDYGRRLSLDALKAHHPDAFVQCGIAEQNQIEVASALANEGGPVFAVSYSPFITARVLDQVRVNLGMMESPVILVGLGAGYAVGELGASHMGLEDLADMRAIPNLTVVSPRDNAELALALEELAAKPRPAYVRITCGKFVAPAKEGVDFAIGRGELLAGPEKPEVALLATGSLCAEAAEAREALEAQGISCAALELATIKPLDTAFLDRFLDAKLWVSVEEHTRIGGFGSVLAEYLAPLAKRPALEMVAAPDAYLEADTQAHLRERAGLTADAIVDAVLKRFGA